MAQLEAKYEQLKREHPNFAYIQTLGELMSEFVYDSVVTGTGPSADEEQCNSICIFKTLVQEAKNMASNTHLSGYLVEVADNFYNSFLLPVHQSMKQVRAAVFVTRLSVLRRRPETQIFRFCAVGPDGPRGARAVAATG